MTNCPQCGSNRLYRDGLRYTVEGKIQRWLCKDCFLRFSNSNKDCPTNSGTFQICTSQPRVKNLDTATQTQSVAGELETEQKKIDPRILQYEWKCRKRQLAEATIYHRKLILARLIEIGGNLDDPETIETVMATHNLPISIKWHMVNFYKSYCKTFNIIWEPPKIKYQPKMPYMPTETEAKTFISALPKTLMVLCRTLFETGCRIGEAVKIEWADINQEIYTIAISHPEKGSNPRVNRVSRELIDLIMSMSKKHGNSIFDPSPRAYDGHFQRARAKLAAKWQHPNINKIHFQTFRHLRGTLDVHNHVPLFEVKTRLGHKCISNTEKYVHWNQQLYHERNDRYNFAAASTIEQVQPLIENGFEYVCDLEGMKLFRKPK